MLSDFWTCSFYRAVKLLMIFPFFIILLRLLNNEVKCSAFFLMQKKTPLVCNDKNQVTSNSVSIVTQNTSVFDTSRYVDSPSG